MKRNWFNPFFISFKWSFLLLAFVVFSAERHAWAATELDIDGDLLSASKLTPTPAAKPDLVMTPTQIAVATPIVSTPVAQAAATPSPVSGDEEQGVGSTPVPGQGVLQMKEVYKVGLSYYQKQDFGKAIRYLKKSLEIHDPYTPKFYYAEANAMLGVIYEFHIIDRPTAYYYYRAALDIDDSTATAKKHIGEVSDKQSK